jgi:hypothetical protein
LPALDAPCAARWLACPLQAEALGDTLVLTMPQMIDPAGIVGALSGTGAVGTNQVTYTGSGQPAVGMWFSVFVGGRNYLHLVTAILATNKVAVSPLLRVALSGVAMDFAAPKLEGFPAEDTTWSLECLRFVGHRFTLTENA